MKIITVLFTFISCINLQAQSIAASDSIEIKSKVEGFYSWYAELIRSNKLDSEFNPSFVKSKNGMTTLDFKKYIQGLQLHSFTRDFINRKVQEYQPCVNNLAKIPYGTFLKFQDLDAFEKIECAFSNVYEWIGGMEPVDGAVLVRLQEQSRNDIEATLEFFSINKEGLQLRYGGKFVRLIKAKSDWKIDDMR